MTYLWLLWDFSLIKKCHVSCTTYSKCEVVPALQQEPCIEVWGRVTPCVHRLHLDRVTTLYLWPTQTEKPPKSDRFNRLATNLVLPLLLLTTLSSDDSMTQTPPHQNSLNKNPSLEALKIMELCKSNFCDMFQKLSNISSAPWFVLSVFAFPH